MIIYIGTVSNTYHTRAFYVVILGKLIPSINIANNDHVSMVTKSSLVLYKYFVMIFSHL